MDYDKVFSPKESSATSVYEDLAAVNKVFSLLYKFCADHHNGVQIIVTDHADDLTIDGLENLEDIVRARWREEGEGLIKMNRQVEIE